MTPSFNLASRRQCLHLPPLQGSCRDDNTGSIIWERILSALKGPSKKVIVEGLNQVPALSCPPTVNCLHSDKCLSCPPVVTETTLAMGPAAPGVHIPGLPFASCMTLDKSLTFSETQLLYL